MLRAGALVRHSLRWGALGLAAAVLIGALTPDPAEARTRRHRIHRAAAVDSYDPPYAAIVVDANTGAVLHAANADNPRHPASLTKIMTLYLLFERLEAGKIKLSTELPVSEHASEQAPSKLGLKPGQTISVDDAIRAIVTKSANDVAVIVAEALGGDEGSFARMMTQKARALGMKNTVYHNASGLPDDAQVTTARDQVLLGRAIQDRFPRYYRYFSTRSFAYRGHAMRNHNKLLGAVAGVDGIKTGYTRASGFNLVTSVRRGARHIVAAVFGGRTASWRDARMNDLIDKYVAVASIKRTLPPVQDAGDIEVASKTKEPKEPPAKEPVVAGGGMLARTPDPVAPPPGSTEPIKPRAVKTVTVRPATLHGGAMGATPSPGPGLAPVTPTKTASVMTVATVKSDMPAAAARPGILGTLPTKLASASDTAPLSEPAKAAPAKPRGGWSIQVGAFDVEADAKQRLSAAQKQAKDLLAQADPFTEKAAKGDKTIYRARFAGLDKDQAENACKHLRRGEIPCMLLKN